jgi:thiamine pyrophosphokinase
MNKCIILANGKPPRKSLIKFFIEKGFSTFICADGGANSALKMDLIPDFIIGDLDSVSDSAIKKYKSVSRIIKIKRQNDTDVEKCLKFAIKSDCKEVVLMGGTGNRLDHTFCNLGIVLKFFKQIKISVVAENSFLNPYSKNIKIESYPGETISIYGIDPKTKISSRGLKYPLKKVSLAFGKKESTSNVSTSKVVELKISSGIIFVIRDINEMIKHDLF